LDKVVDEKGLVQEGEYLTIYIPAVDRALVFRVVSRVNKGYEVIDYGPIPITAGTTLPSYDGGSATVPADGVLPARSYMTGGIQFPPPVQGTYSNTDMWFTPDIDRNRLYHIKLYVKPSVIRTELQIPLRVQQYRFQNGRVTVGVDAPFGFSRGFIETVQLPYVQYGYRFGNDTNLDLVTYVRFVYGEYEVEIPRSGELIFNILTKKIPSYWITLPISYMDVMIKEALRRTYGFTDPNYGFKLYRIDEKDIAVADYSNILTTLVV